MKSANTKLIGLFVAGGIALLVGALSLFASQDLFVKKRYFVAYFEQSIVGLTRGAAIRFRGVPVGRVVDIDGVYDPETGTVTPRLTLEFLPETLKNAFVEEGEYTLFQPLVDRGMRASLKSLSFVTGQLYVSLDFHPDKAVRLLGSSDDPFPEMPTIDSGLDRILSKLEDLPVEQVLGQLGNTLASLEELLRNPRLLAAIDRLPDLVAHTDTAIQGMGDFVASDLPATTSELRRTLAVSSDSLETLTAQLSTETLRSAEDTMASIRSTLAKVQLRLDVNDPLNFELINALRRLSASATSLQQLTDYLEEHPEAFIKGKAE